MSEEFNNLIELAKHNLKYSSWIQEHANIQDYVKELVDEVNEVELAVKNNDLENLKEELGDVLLDTLTMLLICEKNHGFGIDDSIKTIIEKIKRRKPHIFEGKTISSDEELRIWNEAKGKEKVLNYD